MTDQKAAYDARYAVSTKVLDQLKSGEDDRAHDGYFRLALMYTPLTDRLVFVRILYSGTVVLLSFPSRH